MVDWYKDLNLAYQGQNRIDWAGRSMDVLASIDERFVKEKPLKGLKIGACLHLTTETARLMITLQNGGADVYVCASNPLSTQDDVVASLVKNYGMNVFGIKGVDVEGYYEHVRQVAISSPQIVMDDGADLVAQLHTDYKDTVLDQVIAATEETTTGVIRLENMAESGELRFPVIAVNNAMTKHFFDNRYGTGQSTWDGILRATNMLIAGKIVVVVGYGWCGRGVALRAKGLGARVCVVEVNPVRALEALMDGFEVGSMQQLSSLGDVFVTVTGNKHVINASHLDQMKDGAIVCNSGHFNNEIDLDYLRSCSGSKNLRDHVDSYDVNGKEIIVLAEGRLINLSSAEGHPAAVMDMSFANQALSVEYLYKNYAQMENQVYTVPREIDHRVAELKLKSLGVELEQLTDLQREYLSCWGEGTE